ncbi:secretin N-terminal domain-containing protein [Chitinimonas sp.]|uniref:secretin N-terminal domain-containing protein n=1 Tax=Chitinimonas sp. TaxID=1934313 RepID=UPI002F93048F
MSLTLLHRPPLRLAGLTLGLLLLAGCAAQTAYRDGQDLIAKGDTAQGLSKLKEASNLAPDSADYRMAYLNARDRMLGQMLQQAEQALAAHQLDDAEQRYLQILAVDGNHARARSGLQAVLFERRRERLLNEAEQAWGRQDADTAQSRLRSVLAERPDQPRALALQRQIDEAQRQRSNESGLAASYRKPVTLQYKDAPLRSVFDILARTSGLNFLFDKDVRSDQKTSIYLRNSTVESAINLILLTNQLEQRVLDANTILIYPDTAAKRKDYQPMLVRTFYLANAEARAVANTMKTIIKARDVVVDDKLNMIILRDSPDVIRQAEKLVALHDLPEPEVMLEVEVLEVKRTRLMELGIQWPDQLVLTPLQSTYGGTLTLNDLRHLNSRTIGATVSPMTINARDQDTDANLLANPRIRTHNREKSKILIGSRVPVITSTLTSTGFSSESVAYVDVGLKLETEPTIYPDDEVSIKIGLEVSNILKTVETKGTRAYEIGTRTASTVLRLRDGENQVLAGLINSEDRRTANQVPLLGDVPVLGRLFGSNLNDNAKTEIVLSITPRLVRNIRRPDAEMLEFESGTDSNFRRTRLESGGRAPAGGTLLQQGGTVTAAPLPPAAPESTEPKPVASAADGVLSWEGPKEAKPGDTVELRLRYQSELAINGLPLVLGYDPQALEIIKVNEGDYLRNGGSTAFSAQIDAGQVMITNVLSSPTGAKGAGLIATLTAKVLSSDASEARLTILSAAPQAVDGRTLSPALPVQAIKLGH